MKQEAGKRSYAKVSMTIHYTAVPQE